MFVGAPERRGIRGVSARARAAALETAHDLLRDFRLDREDVLEAAVEAFRPEMVTVARTHELRTDTHTVARLAHAALEHRIHTEHATDLAYVGGLALELKCRGARHNLEPADRAQRVDDFFRDAVAEIVLITLGAQIRERQDGK